MSVSYLQRETQVEQGRFTQLVSVHIEVWGESDLFVKNLAKKLATKQNAQYCCHVMAKDTTLLRHYKISSLVRLGIKGTFLAE